ncbi:MAG TPA: hypothetical protein VFE59_29395 [Trebonia sp.]|jgi:hypothetical protein|nr:hypothetical protein [Trebonia sp.]
MSASTNVLTYAGTLTALVLALGTFAWRVSRAVLLHRAGSAALKHGSKDPRGKAGLRIVDALTSDNEPWYRAILPWRESEP